MLTDGFSSYHNFVRSFRRYRGGRHRSASLSCIVDGVGARRRRWCKLAFLGGVRFRVDVEPVQLIVSLDDGHHHRPARDDDEYRTHRVFQVHLVRWVRHQVGDVLAHLGPAEVNKPPCPECITFGPPLIRIIFPLAGARIPIFPLRSVNKI